MVVNLLFLLLFVQYIKIRCSDEILDHAITPGMVETYQITFNKTKQSYLYGFPNKKYGNNLIVHFYSINCNIEINKNKNDIIDIDLPNNKEENMYSFKINKNYISNSSFSINIKNFLINNLNKGVSCPLVINSMEINKETNLEIKESKPIILYFDKNITNINLKYKFKPVNSMFLSFSYHEITFFEINILNKNKTLLDKNDISYSSTLFLTNEIKNIDELIISIKHNDKYKITNSSLLKFELVSNYSQPKFLEKNFLNKEFITSNVKYRYFYTEVNKGQGGEIMLHDKRGSGILIGSIIKKDSSEALIKNFKKYPDINALNNKYNYLNYDRHLHKLSFNFSETEKCEEGCYILISYYHEINDKMDNEVGFEFSLLLRIWDDENFRAQTINIPYNEYIMGCFEETSVKEHYYSIYLSNQTDIISIQIIGELIEGFYKFGKKKLIGYYKPDNESNIFLQNNHKNAFNINTSEYKNNYISFTFKPRREEDILSFYYFRVIQANGDDYFISPLDSNLENICQPQEGNENEFCIFVLRNDFKSFNYNFSIFPSIQAQLFLINYKKISKENYFTIDQKKYSEIIRKNGYIEGDDTSFNFINKFNLNHVKYILFIISLDEIRTYKFFGLHSTFSFGKKELYPSIYSSEIFQLCNINRYINFSLQYNFSIVFNWLNGEGIINLNNYLVKQNIDDNYYGKYYKIPIFGSENNISFNDIDSFIFCLKLEFSKNEEHLELGNPLYEFIQNKEFPLYFMLPIIHENVENIFINFRIIDLDYEKESNFEIEGKIIESESARNYRENNDFSRSKKGNYDICTKFGILNMNIKENKENEKNKENKEHKQKKHNRQNSKNIFPFHRKRGKYVYIKISPKDNNEKYSNVLIQILAMGKNKEIQIPINQYILRQFSSEDEIHHFRIIHKKMQNKYELNEEKNETAFNKINEYNIRFELLGNEKNIKVNFYENINASKLNDTNAYNLNLNNNGNIFDFSINCTNLTRNKGSLIDNYYMIRYISEEEDIKYDYKKDSVEINNNNNSFDISLDNIEISGNNSENNNISFVFYFNLFDIDDINNKELLEVLTPISIKPRNTTKIRVDSQEKQLNTTLYYNNITDDHTYFIQTKINVNKNNDYFYSKNLVHVHVYKTKSKPETGNNNVLNIIIVIIIIVLVTLIFLTLIAYVFYMKKKNKSLKEILKISFLQKEDKEEEDNVTFV